MARAKRTARAEARRRYRAVTEPPADAEVETTEPAPAARAVRQPQPSAKAETGQARTGMFDALRSSIHPVRVREDLAAFPALATHPALFLPILLTLISTVAVIATSGKDLVTPFLFTYFIQTPALGGVFLAGFLAPRASWLLGAIVGAVAAVGYIVVLLVVPSTLSSTAPDAATVQTVSLSALVLSPTLGAFFAALAAWYRRFLRVMSPNRARQATPPRRGDGRTRTTNNSQKAGVRR